MFSSETYLFLCNPEGTESTAYEWKINLILVIQVNTIAKLIILLIVIRLIIKLLWKKK